MDNHNLMTHLPTTANTSMETLTKSSRRAFIYLRCSTPQQMSYQDQEGLCWAYAVRHGIAVIRVIPETASARGRYAEDRPIFRDVLKHALKLDAIVLVANTSRLSRNAKDARELCESGIAFHVAERDRFLPLGRKTLIREIRRAAQNSDNKATAQKQANQTRDKRSRPRGGNLDKTVRARGHHTSQERAANDVYRASRCLAEQVDLEQMTHAQKVDYLKQQGVTRVIKGRHVDWDVQAFRRKWKKEIAPLVNDIRLSNGWFFLIEIGSN